MLQFFTFAEEPDFGFACIVFNIIVLTLAASTGWRHLVQAIKAIKKANRFSIQQEAEGITLEKPQQVAKCPRVSIIIPSRNEAHLLEVNIPRLLNQATECPFEVIIADENSTDNTSLLIERLQKTHENLRSTFIPATSRNIEPRKLAITLGIRAARSEWVIIMNPGCEPASNLWLKEWTRFLDEKHDLVCLYSNYDFDHTIESRRAIYERFIRQIERHSAWKNGQVTGCEPCNLAIRKDWFLKVSGFAESLNLPFGEEAIMANLHAQAERTIIAFSREARCTEEMPSHALCKLQRIYEAETLKHLSTNARVRHRIRTTTLILSHLSILFNLLYILERCIHDIHAQTYSMDFLTTDISLAILCLAGITIPQLLLNRLTNLMEEPTLGSCMTSEVALILWRLLKLPLQLYAHRQEFVRNFLLSNS